MFKRIKRKLAERRLKKELASMLFDEMMNYQERNIEKMINDPEFVKSVEEKTWKIVGKYQGGVYGRDR